MCNTSVASTRLYIYLTEMGAQLGEGRVGGEGGGEEIGVGEGWGRHLSL